MLASATSCGAVDFEVHTAFGEVLQSAPTSSGSLSLKCAPGLVRTASLNVINLSGQQLTGMSASFEGPAANQFVVAHPLPTQMSVSEPAVLVVAFAPQAVMNASCDLIISANELDEGFRISLVGDSNVPGPLLGIKEIGTGEKMHWGDAETFSTFPPEYQMMTTGRLVVTNYGGTDITDLSLALSYSMAVTPAVPAMLPAGQSIQVQMRPSGLQLPAAGWLSFRANNGQTSFTLAVTRFWPFNIISNDSALVSGVVTGGSPESSDSISLPPGVLMNGLGAMPADIASTSLPDIHIECESEVLSSGSSVLRFNPGQNIQTLTIKNVGDGPLTGLSLRSVPISFGVEPALPASLAPGGSTTLRVRCWSTSHQPFETRIEIRSNDPDESPFVIPLIYQGAPRLEASCPSVAVLETHTDAISFSRLLQQTIKVGNVGALPLHGSLTVEGAHSADFSLTDSTLAVEPGETQHFTIKYIGPASGPRVARLNINSNDSRNTSFVTTLVANPGTPHLQLRTAGRESFAFLEVVELIPTPVGRTTTKTFEVTNLSSITQNNLSFVKEGPHSGDFIVSALSRTSLTPGAKAAFAITFNPTAPGDRRTVIRLKRGTVADVAFQLLGIGKVKPALDVEPLGSVIVRVGEILSLDPVSVAGVTLDSDVSFRWLKNGKPIEATSPALELTTASLADAGTYSLKMTNAVGSTILDYAVVKMVQPVITGPAQAASGKPLTLKVQTAGTGLTYQWMDDGTVLQGKTTPIITVVPTEGMHQYYCVVSGGGELTTDILTVLAISQKPILANPGPQEMATNGLLALQLQQTSPEIAPLTFGMSGAPGLRISPTGEVLGTVSTPGSYIMKFWATNAAGTGPVISVPLVVKSIPSVLLGTFAGNFARHGVLNDNLGGRFEITSTSAATYTGLVQLGKRSWRISGKFELTDLTQLTTLDKVLSSGPGFSVQMELSITNYENTPAVAMRLTSQQDGSSVISDGVRKVRPSAELVGRYTSTVGLIPSQITDATPDGMGFATVLVDAAGNLTSSGRLSDGTPFTNTTIAAATDAPFFQLLYGGKGSLLGGMLCSKGDAPQAECNGLFSWLREPNDQDQAYPAGWSAEDVLLSGARYVAPAAGHRILELPATSPNAQFVFSDGNLGAISLAQPVSFGVGNYRVPSTSAAMSGFWVSVNTSTGQITGGFDDRRAPSITVFPLPPAPRYAFYGLLVPTFQQGAGVLLRTSPSPNASRAASMVLKPLPSAP